MENFKERIEIIRDHYFRMLNFANFCTDTHFALIPAFHRDVKERSMNIKYSQKISNATS